MSSPRELELVYVEHRTDEVRRAVDAGIRTFLVDQEWRGKERRQLGRDTEINLAGPAEVAAVAAIPGTTIWSRINGTNSNTSREIDATIAAGAECIFLPMVREVEEVRDFLHLIDGRCKAGILIETGAAVELAPVLGDFDLDYVYVGLNDLAIDRGATDIFASIAEGIVPRVRSAFPNTAFGFAGVTDVNLGDPIPAHLIIRELHRLKCSFSFCRRSFRRDTQAREISEVVAEIESFYRELAQRSAAQMQQDHDELVAAIRQPTLQGNG